MALAPVQIGVGLKQTGDIVDLQISGTEGEIGGVLVPARDATQGLLIDAVTGLLTAPVATDLLAGAILEPPTDGKSYARVRDTAGASTWVEVIPGGAITVSDTPPANPTANMQWWDSDSGKQYVWFTDVDSSQWVQISGGGGGTYTFTSPIVDDAPADGLTYGRNTNAWAAVTGGAGGVPEAPNDGVAYARQSLAWAAVPPGTFVDAPVDTKLYGRKDAAWSEVGTTIVNDAPADTKQYGRQSATNGGALAWTEVTAAAAAGPIVPVADAFPASPVQGQLHFLSSDASLYIYYDDGTSAQWTEVSAP